MWVSWASANYSLQPDGSAVNIRTLHHDELTNLQKIKKQEEEQKEEQGKGGRNSEKKEYTCMKSKSVVAMSSPATSINPKPRD